MKTIQRYPAALFVKATLQVYTKSKNRSVNSELSYKEFMEMLNQKLKATWEYNKK